MALAAAACAFFDVPWPKGLDAARTRPEVGRFVRDIEVAWPGGRTLSLTLDGHEPALDGCEAGDWVTVEYDGEILPHGQITSIAVTATGVRTPSEMRALAGVQ
jgi:hypothetical protein